MGGAYHWAEMASAKRELGRERSSSRSYELFYAAPTDLKSSNLKFCAQACRVVLIRTRILWSFV